jgi:hypothetical protein
LPSVTFDDAYTSVWLDSVVAAPAARFLLTVPAPVPVSATVAVPFDALLAMLRSPVRVPDAVGLNVTFTVQEAFAAIDVPQLLVCEKSPVTVMPETVAAAVPMLVTVTVCALLVVLSAWVGYDNDIGLVDKVAGEEPPELGNTWKSDN